MTSRTPESPTQRRDPSRRSVAAQRAIAMWPRLDMRALRRCNDDPHRIALLVAHRTSMPIESIVGLLTVPSVSPDDGAIWFG